jgi:hypothetical protein
METVPPRTPTQALSDLNLQLMQFFSEEEDSITTWRANYPNDPDAAVAYAEMLSRLGRTDESAQEIKAALQRFPLDMDVVKEAVGLLYDVQREELIPDLFEEVDDLFRSGADKAHKFDDEWSNELFEAKEASRKIAKDERLARFQVLKKAQNLDSGDTSDD